MPERKAQRWGSLKLGDWLTITVLVVGIITGAAVLKSQVNANVDEIREIKIDVRSLDNEVDITQKDIAVIKESIKNIDSNIQDIKQLIRR